MKSRLKKILRPLFMKISPGYRSAVQTRVLVEQSMKSLCEDIEQLKSIQSTMHSGIEALIKNQTAMQDQQSAMHADVETISKSHTVMQDQHAAMLADIETISKSHTVMQDQHAAMTADLETVLESHAEMQDKPSVMGANLESISERQAAMQEQQLLTQKKQDVLQRKLDKLFDECELNRKFIIKCLNKMSAVSVADLDNSESSTSDDFSQKDLYGFDITFNNESVFSISVPRGENKTKLFEMFDQYSLSELYEKSKVTIVTESGNKRVAFCPEVEYPVDEEVILSLLKSSQDRFDRNYILGCYERIVSDTVFFSDNFKDQKDERILIIGDNPPLFSGLISKRGFTDLTVYDPHAEKFSEFFIANSMKWSNIDVTLCQAQGTQFDIIVLNEVLEHLSGNIIDVMNNLSSYLVDGGKIMLTTPNLSSIQGVFGLLSNKSGLASKLNEDVYNQYNRYILTGYYGHLREYTSKEVIDLFAKFNFKLEKVFYRGDWRLTDRPEDRLFKYLEAIFPARRLFPQFIFEKAVPHQEDE